MTRGAGFDHTFGYDSAGNPTSFRGVAKAYNANNQQSDSGFTHDSNGNPTTYGGVSLTFDPENRLTSYGALLTAGYRGDTARRVSVMTLRSRRTRRRARRGDHGSMFCEGATAIPVVP